MVAEPVDEMAEGTARLLFSLNDELKALFRKYVQAGLTVDDIGETVEHTLQGQWEE